MKPKLSRKPGAVYEISGTQPKRYLQFVMRDDKYLGTDLVLIFNDEDLTELEYYTYTNLSGGVKGGQFNFLRNQELRVSPEALRFVQYVGERDVGKVEEPFCFIWRASDSELNKVDVETGSRFPGLPGGAVGEALLVKSLNKGGYTDHVTRELQNVPRHLLLAIYTKSDLQDLLV